MEYDKFLRIFDDNISKIVTYFSPTSKKKTEIKILNVSDIKYFD